MMQAVQSYRTWLALALVSSLSAGPALADNKLLRQFEAEFVELSENVAASVVEISVESSVSEGDRQGLDDMFRFFQGPEGEEEAPEDSTPPEPRRRSSKGSGFIVSEDGYIVTNNHVVQDAEIVTVLLHDGNEYPAEVIGLDPGADIAVVKVDAPGVDLRPLRLGDSDGVKPGQFAMAVGSPRGLSGSFSYGHITGIGREDLQLPGRELRFQHFIQTDAAINLGNSGGPLINLDGEVVGVNIAIVYGANSIGFAIPANRVAKIVPQLIDSGEVVRGWLGVSILDLENAAALEKIEIADYIDAFELPDAYGTSVRDTTYGGPARAAGLKENDVIRKVAGIAITNSQGLIDVVSDIEPGTSTELEVWRDGKRITLPIEIAKWPGQSTALYGAAYLGMHITEPLDSKQAREQLELDFEPEFFVAEVVKDSPAAKAGIKRGDLILEIGHEDSRTRDSFEKLVGEKGKPGKTVLVKVLSTAPPAEEPADKFLKIPEDYQP